MLDRATAATQLTYQFYILCREYFDAPYEETTRYMLVISAVLGVFSISAIVIAFSIMARRLGSDGIANAVLIVASLGLMIALASMLLA